MEAEYRRLVNLDGNGTNYQAWKFQVSIMLKANGIFDVVEKTREQGTGKEEILKWNDDDLKAQKILITSVSEKIITHLIACKTSSDMWLRIKALYAKSTEASIHSLQQKFYAYVYKGDGVARHVADLENLSHELKTCGEEISENMLINKILMTLPEEFKHFYSAWDSSNIKTLNILTSRLIMEEERINNRQQNQEVDGALTARKSNKIKSKNDRRKTNFKQNDICHYCKKKGHWARDCWFNKDKSSRSKIKTDDYALMSDVESNMKFDWFLDSGASHHMTSYNDWFADYEKFKSPKYITIGDGTKLEAVGIGVIPVQIFKNNEWVNGNIQDVFHVPKLMCNLYSASNAVDKGYVITTKQNGCEIKINNNTIVSCVRVGNLFKLKLKLRKLEAAHYTQKKSEKSLEQWHQLLVHQNIQYCKSILENNGLKVQNDQNFQCESCIYGKQCRQPFKTSNTVSSKPGEIIHVDVCGPMEKISIGGSKYFLLLKDDFTRHKTVYFLKYKSEVYDKLKEYIPKFKVETGETVKIIRSDNGLEFKNKNIKTLLKGYGIKHQFTVAYTPEQNGAAEREMRTLVEAARSILHTKNLGQQFWAEAINTVAYVLNRTGKSTISGKTPFELMYKKKPCIDNLQIFGNEVFVHIPKEKRKKWDFKSKNGIFVGYSEETKGYRIYFPGENKIDVCRDVIFKETNCQSQSFGIEKSTDSIQKEATKDSFKIENVNNENNTVTEENETVENQQVEEEGRVLRDRSQLKPPNKYNDYISLIACTEIEYSEAVKDHNWKQAMNEEINALNINNTWKLTYLPKGKQAIGNKWIFRIKSNNQYKARLVAKGCSQKYGRDYLETFSPVAQYKSIRLLLSVAATLKLHLSQFDIKTAFLNGSLEEEIYMEQPMGFEDGTERVCYLTKCIYGLKQAPRNWNFKFIEVLKRFSLKQSENDPCIFIGSGVEKLYLIIYVDDGLIVSSSVTEIDKLLKHLENNFDIKRDNLNQFLGMQITKEPSGDIFVKQEKYITKMLERFNMSESKSVNTPGPTKDMDDKESVPFNGPYREAIGSLLFLSSVCRPDITYAVNKLSRYMESPKLVNWEAIKRVFRYLNGTKEYGLRFKSDSEGEGVKCYSDADFAGDAKTRKSTSGYLMVVNGTAVDWYTRRQSVIALSTSEAEYIAASEAVKQLIIIGRLCEELNLCKKPITLKLDNQSTIKMIGDETAHKRTKHIDVRYHFIKSSLGKEFNIEYVQTEQQLADIFTKSLAGGQFQFIRDNINLKQEGVLK